VDISTNLHQVGDSICGVPCFGCINGARLLDSDKRINGDTTTIVVYIKKLNVKYELSRWYPTCDIVDRTVFVRGKNYSWEHGIPIHAEDSIRLQELSKTTQ
jgi:hypothetical protein